MSRNRKSYKAGSRFSKRKQNALIVTFLALIIAVLVLSILYIRLAAHENEYRRVIRQNMRTYISSAIEQTNRLSNIVNSSTASRMGVIRQYVYAAQQMSELSAVSYGRAAVDAQLFEQVFADIDAFETLIQTTSTSILAARTDLLNDLDALFTVLTAETL